MLTVLPRTLLPAALLALSLGACDSPTDDDDDGRGGEPAEIPALGVGTVSERQTSEVWVHGSHAYTGTLGRTAAGGGTNPGNVVKVWNVAGSGDPVLVDSLVVPAPEAHEHAILDGEAGHGHGEGPGRIGDLQVSDDGRLLLVATELGPGSIVLYDLADPARPALLTVYHTDALEPGVHTAELARVGGRLYGFLSINPAAGIPAKLVIVDLGDPLHPVEVWSRAMGDPFQHDVFVRDGVLFTAEWDAGVGIWDIGGAGRGGSPGAPVLVSRTPVLGGNVHNLFWLRDPATGQKRWLLTGEEQPTEAGYRGDVHVLDVSNLAAPREVAFFHVDNAGAHNFAVDETRGILYAAFYTAGVRALDVRGDLGSCAADQKDATGRCDLGRMGREAGRGLHDGTQGVDVWGVHLSGSRLFASDIPNGLWKLDVSALR